MLTHHLVRASSGSDQARSARRRSLDRLPPRPSRGSAYVDASTRSGVPLRRALLYVVLLGSNLATFLFSYTPVRRPSPPRRRRRGTSPSWSIRSSTRSRGRKRCRTGATSSAALSAPAASNPLPHPKQNLMAIRYIKHPNLNQNITQILLFRIAINSRDPIFYTKPSIPDRVIAIQTRGLFVNYYMKMFSKRPSLPGNFHK
jgi:hypothetical protein